MPVHPAARSLPSHATQSHLSSTAALWRLHLLGRFRLIDAHGIEQAPLRSRSATVMLAWLAMAPGRHHAREELIDLLWPDVAAEAGRTRLRQTLLAVRAVLEPPGGSPVLLADRRVLRLAPGVLWCDAVAFEAACASSAASAAHGLYGGELLPGFTHEWVVETRARLAGMRTDIGPPALPAFPAGASLAPAIRPGSTAVSRLPSPLSSLFGTEDAEAGLRDLVTRCPRVTVVGPAGVGKTRLALQVARHLAADDGGRTARFDRTFFVPLHASGDADGLRHRLQALPLSGSGGDPEAHALVVLDQPGPLDHRAVRLLADMADRLPRVHWLITSRDALGIAGEQVFALEPLPLPAPDASLAQLAKNPAVLLYVDRARAQRAEFRLQAGNGAALAALVRWLGGVPLAIERAASHVRTQGPAEWLATLQED